MPASGCLTFTSVKGIIPNNFTNLYVFTGGNDGANPSADLILSGTTLYGTAKYRGSGLSGTIFRINLNGTGFTNVYSFTANSAGNNYQNSDGANPNGRLVLSGGVLYGTAENGGAYGHGTAFRVNTNGSGFTNLHSFAGSSVEGSDPQGGLVLAGNTLYGTTYDGGSQAYGTVFAVNTDGSGFTTVHHFFYPDGTHPQAGLILASNVLYGTTIYGDGFGTVFAIKTDGSGFRVVNKFGVSGGLTPRGGMLLWGDALYGTTASGGVNDAGMVFAVRTDGTRFQNLHNFIYTDGCSPLSGLTLSGHTLYGTVSGCGAGSGTLFSVVVQPQLTLGTAGTNFVFSWPTNFTGFALQSAPELTGAYTNIAGATNPFTNPVTGAQQFFRLNGN